MGRRCAGREAGDLPAGGCATGCHTIRGGAGMGASLRAIRRTRLPLRALVGARAPPPPPQHKQRFQVRITGPPKDANPQPP